jgi:hypothetical protein
LWGLCRLSHLRVEGALSLSLLSLNEFNGVRPFISRHVNEGGVFLSSPLVGRLSVEGTNKCTVFIFGRERGSFSKRTFSCRGAEKGIVKRLVSAASHP